jgi:hypothetical protein
MYGGGYYGGGGYYPGGSMYGGGYYGGYGGTINSGIGYAGYGYPGMYNSGAVPTMGPFGYTGVYQPGYGYFNLPPGSIAPYSISGDWLKGMYMPYMSPSFQMYPYTGGLMYTYGQSQSPSNFLGMSILGSRSAIAGLGGYSGLWGGFW